MGQPEIDAWVQITAVAAEQTKNTGAYMQTIFNRDCRERYGLDINKEKTFSADGRRIEITSSSWRTMEGNRVTWAVENETQHWRDSTEGHTLHQVIRRNIAKNPGGLARACSITNAYRPGEGSVAELQRTKYEEAIELRGHSPVMYDTLESPKGTPLIPKFTRVEVDADGNEWAITDYNEDGTPVDPSFEVARWWIERILTAVRGDALWLDPVGIATEILTGEVPGEEALRFYFNSSATAEDTYLAAEDIDATIDDEARQSRRNIELGDPLRIGWKRVSATDEIVVFGDGSKSNDATGLVGCRLSDGYVFTLGIWQRPAGSKKKAWLSPRAEVDARVDEIFGRFNVVGFWFDPSHTKEDETGAGYWDALVDGWHQRYGDRLRAWGRLTGDMRSSVSWDMTSPMRQIEFVAGVARYADDIESRGFTHDGHPALVNHMRNARNFWTKAGWSISKASRGSKDKIDLCVCAVGARMLRRVVLNLETEKTGAEKKSEPAVVWW